MFVPAANAIDEGLGPHRLGIRCHDGRLTEVWLGGCRPVVVFRVNSKSFIRVAVNSCLGTFEMVNFNTWHILWLREGKAEFSLEGSWLSSAVSEHR